MTKERDPEIATWLEMMYGECNRMGRLKRDPLAIVVQYEDIPDREIVGLVCSILAFGKVDLILDACSRALAPLGGHPASVLKAMSDHDIEAAWAGFQYRFCFPCDMIALMKAIRDAIITHGSLQATFLSQDSGEPSILGALGGFVRVLRAYGLRPNLLPDPADGSACKRLLLFLRWMVRKDDIDPGGWGEVSPSRLIVPLDVHMARLCREKLGFLAKRKGPASPTMKEALEATRRFALYSPEDPVKYDFALTRPGIDPMPGDEILACP
jgi:uncharacterized protein (TIGR02757 family)